MHYSTNLIHLGFFREKSFILLPTGQSTLVSLSCLERGLGLNCVDFVLISVSSLDVNILYIISNTECIHIKCYIALFFISSIVHSHLNHCYFLPTKREDFKLFVHLGSRKCL